MGLLGEIYSAGDSAKRKLKGLLSDPAGELGLLGARASEDMQNFIDLGAMAYPMLDPRLKPRLDTPQGRERVVAQNAARQQFGDMAGNMGMAAATVWHGSPHKFDRFDSSKIGTGEGAQAYGHGLYLADQPGVAESYRTSITANLDSPQWSKLQEAKAQLDKAYRVKQAGGQWLLRDDAGKVVGVGTDASRGHKWEPINAAQWDRKIKRLEKIIPPGNLYKVDLPDEAIAKMLDWDKPLSQQAPEVRDLVNSFIDKNNAPRMFPGAQQQIKINKDMAQSEPGRKIYDLLKEQLLKRELDIPGIKYLDGGSRGAGTGTRNYVVFPGNEGLLTILERNGVAP